MLAPAGTSQDPPPSIKAHRIPRRTEDIKLHDKMIREIVDPKRFASAYRVSEEDTAPKKLNIEQLESLMRALKVKTRGSQSLMRFSHVDGPGPGSYNVPACEEYLRAKTAPKMRPDVNEGHRFRMGDAAHFPGPGAYNPKTSADSTIKSSPRVTMSSRLEDRITVNNRRVQPGPGSYNPFKPLGADLCDITLHDRAPFQHAKLVSQGPGPGAYMLPSTLKGSAVTDWSPPREPSRTHNSGPLDTVGIAQASERRYRRPRRHDEFSTSADSFLRPRPPASSQSPRNRSSNAPTPRKNQRTEQQQSPTKAEQQQQSETSPHQQQ